MPDTAFDTFWKEHGSLHNDIFRLTAEEREPYRRVAQAAWDYVDAQLKEAEINADEKITELTDKIENQNEKIDDLHCAIINIKEAIDEATHALP